MSGPDKKGSTQLRASLVFLFIFLIFSMPAAADISIVSEVDRATMTVGDNVHYRLVISYTPDISIVSPPGLEQLGPFRIKQSKRIEPKEQAGKIQTGIEATITAYRVGEYMINPATISYRGADGAIGQIQSEPLYITIQSVHGKDAAPEAAEDIRPLKTIKDWRAEIFSRQTLPWFLGAAALGLSIMVVVMRRKRFAQIGNASAHLNPRDRALQDLAELLIMKFRTEEDVRNYFVVLSGILRTYIQNGLKLPALELTTRELLVMMRSKSLIAGQEIDALQTILNFCDLVKFAKILPDPREIKNYGTQAQHFVQTCASGAPKSETDTPQPA